MVLSTQFLSKYLRLGSILLKNRISTTSNLFAPQRNLRNPGQQNDQQQYYQEEEESEQEQIQMQPQNREAFLLIPVSGLEDPFFNQEEIARAAYELQARAEEEACEQEEQDQSQQLMQQEFENFTVFVPLQELRNQQQEQQEQQ